MTNRANAAAITPPTAGVNPGDPNVNGDPAGVSSAGFDEPGGNAGFITNANGAHGNPEFDDGGVAAFGTGAATLVTS